MSGGEHKTQLRLDPFFNDARFSLFLEDDLDAEDIVALVPYIDLINHNPNSESRIRGVGTSNRYACRG